MRSLYVLGALMGCAAALPSQFTGQACGGPAGLSCLGTLEGPCCSSDGVCGSSSVHCDAGCQPEYGTCNAPRILKRKRASPCKPSKSTISSGPETTTLPASSAGTSSVEDSTNTIPTTLSTSSLTTTSQVLEPESTSSTALSTHDTSEFSTSTETSSLEDSTTTIHTTSVLPSTTSTEAQQPQQTSCNSQQIQQCPLVFCQITVVNPRAIYSDLERCPQGASKSNPSCATDADCVASYGQGYVCIYDDANFCPGGTSCAHLDTRCSANFP